MPIARRLVRYFRPYRGWVVLALVSMIGVALGSAGVVFMTKALFDDVLVPQNARVAAAPEAGPAEKLPAAVRKAGMVRWAEARYEGLKRRLEVRGEDRFFVVPLLFLAAFAVKSFFSFFAEYSFNRVGLAVVRDLRVALYERVVRQSARFFSERPTGELISRIVTDVEVVQNAVSNRMGDLFQETFTLVALLVYVFSLNARMAALSLLVAPAVILPVVIFGKKLRRTTRRSQERMAELTTVLEESIKGNRIVKAFAMEEFEAEKFRAGADRYLAINLKARFLSSLSSPIMESIGVLCAFALISWAGYQISHGAMTLGDFASFVAGLYMMYAPVKKLNKVNLVVQQALSASQRIFEMLDEPNEVIDAPGATALAPFRERLLFRDVRFSYGGEEVLRGVDLAIEAGTVCALVGPSGAGKSTLAALVPRFYDPTGGLVAIDGADVRGVTLASLRGQIGVVTQEVVLFNDTVRRNIAYGRAEVGIDRIEEAARAAFAHEFIAELPQGYDTPIGEAGVRLSGGQRQRLAIARALLKDPPILLLDEATSALDTESELLVQRALYRLMEGRTALVIAHRLSTVRRADMIVVLERGRIVERGRHDELLALEGSYKRLFDMQFADAPAGAEESA